jgi:hypothetical protein
VKPGQHIEADTAQRNMLRCSKKLLDIYAGGDPDEIRQALDSDDIERLAAAVGVGAPDLPALMDQLVRACEDYAAAVTDSSESSNPHSP